MGRIMFKKIVSICLIIFLIVITSQAVFAVDDNSTISVESIEEPVLEDFFDEIHVDIKGNDDNQGDALHPVSSIKKAINISKDSSKIIVHEGVYKESNLNINKSLQIQGQGNVVIDAENKDRIITINSNTTEHVVLSGITFLNGNSNQMAGAIYVLKAVFCYYIFKLNYTISSEDTSSLSSPNICFLELYDVCNNSCAK